MEGDHPAEVKEKQVISCVLTISGIPSAADYLYFDTDLEKYDDNPIYNFTKLNLQSNESHFELPVKDNKEKIVVQLYGQVPGVTEVQQYEKLTLVKYDPKRTGYAYYRIKPTDEKGNAIQGSDTSTFTIEVTDIDSFEKKATQIEDPFLSMYLQDMFDRGLVTEANKLADYLIEKKTDSLATEEESQQFKEKLNGFSDPVLGMKLQAFFDLGLHNESNELADYLLQEKADASSMKWKYALGFLVTALLGFVIGVRLKNSEEEE
ncbi:hypothetical protein MSBRW_2278 [Methanosarcina barkeri str. Wiesmoor]|uniref:Uncharacterized protein n=1 Tax=Methanosarcina barkeri str. Wiesmoor TaxID=1434109 RepID=A0A0E3LLM5_METBA|nr:hypothetical protein MSBRW_2278 [Methanosarcina barkeri str. Wiesmoor]